MKRLRLVLLPALLVVQVATNLPALQDGSSGLEVGRWGYVDKSGSIVIPSRFESAGEFADGLARVEVNKKWGYIDRAGSEIIPPQFEEAGGFSEGMAPVKIDGKWGVHRQGRKDCCLRNL